MLKLSYPRPLTGEALGELEQGLFRLKARIKRRRALSVVCALICFLLHTALMSFSAVSLYAHQAGAEYTALLGRIPYLAEADAFVFQELPTRFGIGFAFPQLFGVGAAILLPPLVCLVVTLLLRLVFRARVKDPIPPDASESERLALLTSEVEALDAKSRLSRKANWTVCSAALSFLLCAGMIAWSLYVIRPASDDLDLAYFASYIFIGLILFTALFIAAYVTDSFTAFLCALDAQWKGDALKADLHALGDAPKAKDAGRDPGQGEEET